MSGQIQPKGTLIPIGGNEDKGIDVQEKYVLDFVTDGILAHVVRESGGRDSSFVVIPTASSIPVEVGRNYLQAFNNLGCSKVKILQVQSRVHSDSKDYVKWIEQADCVMFTGGDQSQIVDKIGGSRMHHVLKERYLTEKFVIAGTSAGAMCMSSEMIMGGSSAESMFKGAVLMREGMGFIPGLIIDSHFIRRGRFGRLAEAVARFPHLIGVGLSEDTGLIIKNGNDCTVIGSGMAIFMDPGQLIHNNERILQTGTPMTLTNLIVHTLSNSDGFHLEDRSIRVLPLNAEFM
ncbi:MAG: cyanophycinase [Bacteroidia bacterium]|nr:cyanophycinase [Bacteroidia bacterium]